MNDQPKKFRPTMHLPQLSKRVRLTRRFLGQWKADLTEQLPNRIRVLVP